MGCMQSLEEGSGATGSAMQNLNRTSVIDTANLAAKKATAETTKKKKQFQNIFAAPLEHDANFKAPSYPKSRAQRDFIKEAILGNFVFSNLDKAELNVMLDAFEKVAFNKNDLVITEGEEGDYYYVIEEGTVQFSVHGKDVGVAKRGDTFGELALLYSAPRAATCKALSDTNILFRVDQKTFRHILQSKTENADKIKRDLIKNLDLFKDLDSSDLNRLADNMVPRTFKEGETIFKKGSVGDQFYVIQEGTVKVTEISAGGKTYEDMELDAGDYFGERALILKEPRAATCTAGTDLVALSVDSDTFKLVMGNLDELAMRKFDKRKLLGIEILKKTNIDDNDAGALAACIKDDKMGSSKILFAEGKKTPATLYFVRHGLVELTKKGDESFTKTIGHGGYFGEEMLLLDVKVKDNDGRYTADFTAETIGEEVVLGKLSLVDCRTVLDTTTLGSVRKHTRVGSVRNEDVDIGAVKYHSILGAGTFGQVWLVSRQTSGGTRHPYALKVQSKYELIKHSQAKGVVQEKDIMQQLKHPFIIRLVNTSQTKSLVFMLLEIVQGGELFSLMHKPNSDGLPIEDSIFYSAGILEGLGHMHRRSILYRDLKPENVLVDADGYPVIVDLGFAKVVTDKTYTLCGTPLYLAPEVILNRGHDKGADHWSLGVMIFEMLGGDTPFYQDGMDQIALFRSIVKADFKFPTSARKRANFFTDDAKSLISQLLTKSPSRRLGSLAGGEKDIYNAPFFQSISFEKLKAKQITAPWKPTLKDPLDSSNFENWNHLQDKTKVKEPSITKRQDKVFESF